MMPAFRAAFRDRTVPAAAGFVLLALIALAAPLFFWPAATDSFVMPKSVLLEAGTWLLLGAALAQFCTRPALRIALHPINGLLLLWLAWTALSLLWTVSVPLTLEALQERALVALFAFLAQSLLLHDRRRLIALGWIMTLATLLVSLLVLAADFRAGFGATTGVRSVLGDWRDVIGAVSFGNSGHVADFLAHGFLITLALALTVRGRGWFGVTAVILWLAAAALIASWSVHTNLSLIVGAGLFGVLLLRWRTEDRFRRMLKRLVPLAAGWIVVVLFFSLNHPLNPHGRAQWEPRVPQGIEASALPGIWGQAFSSPRWVAGGPTRLAIWLNTLEIAREAPWLGTGAGTFTWMFPATRSELLMENESLAPYAGAWTNAAHNEVLETWSNLGIVGVFLLIGVVGAAFWFASRRLSREGFGNGLVMALVIGMLAAWCVQAQMNFPLRLPWSTWFLAFLVSIPVILPERQRATLLLPVSRPYPLIEAGIMLENMRVPRELTLVLNVPRAARVPAAVVLALLMLPLAWSETAELRASALYRPVYDARRTGLAAGNEAALIGQARAALEVDPTLTDARSALTELLVQSGRMEEALVELEKLEPWLNGTEVYLRRAVALDALGREGEALEAWGEVFRRQPGAVGRYPRQFTRWAATQEANAEGSGQVP